MSANSSNQIDLRRAAWDRRDQRGLGIFRLQIMDDRAGVGEREVAVAKRRHLPNGLAARNSARRVRKAGRLELELDAFLAGIGEDLARNGDSDEP